MSNRTKNPYTILAIDRNSIITQAVENLADSDFDSNASYRNIRPPATISEIPINISSGEITENDVVVYSSTYKNTISWKTNGNSFVVIPCALIAVSLPTPIHSYFCIKTLLFIFGNHCLQQERR